MVAKHTPGPWSINRSKNGYPYQIYAANGTHVRSVTRWAALSVPALPEGEANAHLIAAAPDLLAACKEIATDRWPDLTLQEQADRLKRANAAIRKAEGQ